MVLLNEIRIVVEGPPQKQQRHRTATRDRAGNSLPFPRMYDPSAGDKQKFLKYVKRYAPEQPIIGPIDIEAKFYLPVAKSLSKKSREELHLAPATKKPDIDNALKFYLDAMNGTFWVDDQQVTHANISKLFDKDNPRVELTIKWETN